MEQYIPKSALVAEIKRLLAFYSKEIEDNKEDPWAMDIAKRDILQEVLSFIDTHEVKEVPIWEKVSPDTGQTTLYKNEDKSYLERFGYRIDLNELDKLPKKNLKAQKGEKV